MQGELQNSCSHHLCVPLPFNCSPGSPSLPPPFPPSLQAATREGATPLHHACAGGHRSVAELLLEQGAEVDCRAADGSTCLLAAAGLGRCVCVCVWGGGAACFRNPAHLPQRVGMHIDLHRLPRTQHGTPPTAAADSLQCRFICPAAEAGHSHVVKALLRRGADPNAADAHGLTPLAAALVDGHRRCAGTRGGGRGQPGVPGQRHPARLPTQRAAHSAPSPADCTPALLPRAEALLAASAAPPPRAVHYAAHHGMARVLSKLLEGPAAAEINEADETG